MIGYRLNMTILLISGVYYRQKHQPTDRYHAYSSSQLSLNKSRSVSARASSSHGKIFIHALRWPTTRCVEETLDISVKNTREFYPDIQ